MGDCFWTCPIPHWKEKTDIYFLEDILCVSENDNWDFGDGYKNDLCSSTDSMCSIYTVDRGISTPHWSTHFGCLYGTLCVGMSPFTLWVKQYALTLSWRSPDYFSLKYLPRSLWKTTGIFLLAHSTSTLPYIINSLDSSNINI